MTSKPLIVHFHRRNLFACALLQVLGHLQKCLLLHIQIVLHMWINFLYSDVAFQGHIDRHHFVLIYLKIGWYPLPWYFQLWRFKIGQNWTFNYILICFLGIRVEFKRSKLNFPFLYSSSKRILLSSVNLPSI